MRLQRGNICWTLRKSEMVRPDQTAHQRARRCYKRLLDLLSQSQPLVALHVVSIPLEHRTQDVRVNGVE